jgi:TolB-like protein/DNA-binding winged helix-turn-helix (wHTH) protein
MSNNKTRPIGNDGLHFCSQNLQLIQGDDVIKLDVITTKLLCYFLDNPDVVLTRTNLVDNVWPSNFITDNTINSCISTLRKSLGGNINSYITTVPKVGYRFSHSPNAKVQKGSTDDSAPPVVEQSKVNLSQANQSKDRPPATSPSEAKVPRKLWLVAGGLLTLVLLIVILYLLPKQAAIQSTTKSDIIKIAVLPFANISKTRDQQAFVYGLSEEVIISLSQIPGLQVISNKAPDDKLTFANIDLQQTAAALGVQYLLRGSVSKNGNAILFRVKLIEAQYGVILFSSRFEHTLTDTFAIQQQISEQVAAALKLSLIHKNNHYSSALAKLDHLGVEQLVVARAQVKAYSTQSIKQAFSTLTALNQRYPDTPEVIGLLAYTSKAIVNFTNDNNQYQSKNQVNLAKSALALDPSNFDALMSLYYNYAYYPQLREQTYAVSEAILRYHPSQQSSYRSRLHLMIMGRRPCEEIVTFVNAIPSGVFTSHRLKIIHHILDVCLRALPLPDIKNIETTLEPQKFLFAINSNIRFFRTHHDMIFDAIRERARFKPSQLALNNDHKLLLSVGAIVEAATIKNQIDHNGDGFWRWLSSIHSTLNNSTLNNSTLNNSTLNNSTLNQSPNTIKLADSLHFAEQVSRYHWAAHLAGALIVQAKQSSDPTILTRYLATMAKFPINLLNTNEAIGLMMLQYHSNQLPGSKITAKKLFYKLERYRQAHPKSFKFWTLGGHYLIAKMHCGDGCIKSNSPLTAKNLSQLFMPNYHYWTDDLAFTQVALSPWKNHPIVVEYLSRIEQDRQRFVRLRGLD